MAGKKRHRRKRSRAPRERVPLPLQRPWVRRSRKAEEERRLARRPIKPWERPEQ